MATKTPAKKAAATPARPRRRPPKPRVDTPPGPVSRIHDEALRAQIVSLTSLGVFRTTIAQEVGVPRRTIDSWLARGRASVIALWDAFEALDAGEAVSLPEPDEPFHSFFVDVDRADGHAEVRAVGQVQNHIRGNPNAGLPPSERMLQWWMERRWPERYGGRLTLAGDAAAPLTVRQERRVDLWTTEERLAEVVAALGEAGNPLGRRLLAAGAVIDVEASEGLRA